jgi:hypothetical protein
MTRYLLLASIFGLSLTRAPAQQPVRYFELTPPAQKVSGSLYRHIEFMDSRPAADGATYTWTDIARIDSIEEQSLPLYTANSFTDGIYLNYNSFSKQIPDKQGMIKAKRDGTISSVHILDDSARKVRLRPKNFYALVYKGKPYIATEFGIYPIERVRDNFFFTGDIHIRASGSEVAELAILIGIGTAIGTAEGFEETYDLLIDPLNGNFIHLRKLEKPQNPQNP